MSAQPLIPRPIDELMIALINLKYDGYTRENRLSVADKSLALDFGISPQTFSNYITAKRHPRREAEARPMASNWWQNLEPHQQTKENLEKHGFRTHQPPDDEITEHLMKSTYPADAAAQRSAPSEGLTGRVWIDYGLFSNGENGVFDRILDRYFRQLGLQLLPVPEESFGFEKSFKKDESFIIQCYFAEPSRKEFRFLRFPLRISLGAVADVAFKSQAHVIADALTGNDTTRIRPIVIRDEVGHLFCKHTRGLSDAQLHIENKAQPPNQLADRLTSLSLSALQSHTEARTAADDAERIERDAEKKIRDLEDRGGDVEKIKTLKAESAQARTHAEQLRIRVEPIPVLVIDEYTAMLVLRDLKGGGFPALPIAGIGRNRSLAPRREMPLFFMSLAWLKGNKFAEPLIYDTLSTFLESETETTARVLAEAFDELQQHAYDAMPKEGQWYPDTRVRPAYFAPDDEVAEHSRRIIARSFALYTMSLNRQVLDEPPTYIGPWRAILRRTRQLVQSSAVTLRKRETIDVLEGILGYYETDGKTRIPVPLSDAERLSKIVEFTDIPFSMDTCRGMFADELFELFEAYLNDPSSAVFTSGPSTSTIEIKSFNPDPEEVNRSADRVNRSRGVLQVVNQLAQMYYRLPPPIIEAGSGEGAGADVKKKDPGTLPAPSAKDYGKEIYEAIRRDASRGFRDYAQIFYATSRRANADSKFAEYVGCLFIKNEPGGEGAESEKSCEIKYLWVSEHYRGRNVSRLMLAEARRWIRREGYTFARVAILPSLESAIGRILEARFHPRNPREYDKKNHEGRLIFEYDFRNER
jgi:GNAT superfamily N-acetyltransferase